jgi:hypothetical protein
MKDDDVKKFADQPLTSKVYLKDGTVVEGRLKFVEEGIYNVIPLPSRPGVIQGGFVPDITEDEIERIE